MGDFLCQQDIESWSEEMHNLERVIEPSGVYPTLSTVPTLRKSHGTDRPCKLSLANVVRSAGTSGGPSKKKKHPLPARSNAASSLEESRQHC